jgi:hypothetical protein
MKKLFMAVLVGFTLSLSGMAKEATVTGDYVEVRTADVYAGPCFANAEVNLDGQEALLAWRVREGSWQGVSLDGLSVVAVVKANATLGDPFADPHPARSILVVDERATPKQQDALTSLARSMGGDLLQDIVWTKTSKIDLELGADEEASLKAGNIAALETRALHHGDHLCGNEFVYYSPLTEISNAVPAYTILYEFRGDGLNSSWKSFGKRSAYIGTFAY